MLLDIIQNQFSDHRKHWIPNTSDKQDSYQKSHLMMMIEEFKKDLNKSLKELQENTGKQVEDLKE